MNFLKENIEILYQTSLADCEALEDAKMTLEAIKEALPTVFDEIIKESLDLIEKALNADSTSPLEELEKFIDFYENTKKERNKHEQKV